jgi:NitT/TauT family transport system substrate-binding protein
MVRDNARRGRRIGFMLSALAGALLLFAGGRAEAAEAPLVFGMPGIPPVFLSVEPYVAQEQGFFKKYGADVTLRQFDSGAAATRAVVAGDVDITITPTPMAINLISNAGAKLVGVYGLENPDWLLASTDPAIKSCKDLPGHPISVDTPGGARSIALKQMVSGCVNFASLEQVGLGSHTADALIAHQITVGVLHLDDVAKIEEHLGHPLTIVTTLKKVKPISHYDLFTVRSDKLAKDRDRYVRVIAGLIAADNFMRDPKNLDRVAEIAKVTGHTPAESKAALKKYLAIDFWPDDTDGLDEKKIDFEIKLQVAAHNIKPGKTPVAYGRLVDRTVWRDAMALVKKGS